VTLHGSRSRPIAYWILIPSAMPRRFAGRCAIIVSETIAVAALAVAIEWRATGTIDWASLALAWASCAGFCLVSIPLNEWMHRRLGEPRRPSNRIARFGVAVLAAGLVLLVIGSISGWDWATTSAVPISLVGCVVMLVGIFTSIPPADARKRSVDSR